MKTSDKLKDYLSSLDALRAEKTQLEARLDEIDQALTAAGVAVGGRRGVRRPRARNEMSLRDAVAQVTRNRPLTKPEILEAIQKIGYKFSTDDPMNSLNAMLYSPKSRIRRQNGKFTAK